jgi:acyl-coenzyme A thioesterase 13
MPVTDDPVAGFETYAEPSGFLDRIGPFMQRRTETGVIFGVRVSDYHCNRRGIAHGGLIVTLANVALGKTGEWFSRPPVSLLTASLTVDFYGAARLGDWIEARSDVSRVGRQVAFGNCYLSVGEKPVARASGVFNVRSDTAHHPIEFV